MEVSNRKPVDLEVKIENLRSELSFYQKSIDRVDKIKDELKGELWKEVKDRLTLLIKSIDDQEYQYAKGSKLSASLDLLLGQKAAAIDVLSIEEFVNSRKRFEDKVVELREQIVKLSGGTKFSLR